MDYSIEKYVVKGNFYIWKYKESNPNKITWNFSADTEGCESLLQLLNLIEESPFSSRKSIKTTTPPTQQIAIPNDRNIEWTAKSLIELKHIKSGSNQWVIEIKKNSIEIIFGVDKMHDFKKAISKVKAGEGDFAISGNEENHILYFWHHFKK